MSLDLFHPTVRRWFADEVGAPTRPQREGWPAIRSGEHVLIAAPTGTGKTLSAFLAGLDALLRQGADLADETQVLYVSPLRALSNDVQKNLSAPLARLREIDPSLPEVRVLVRTGDTLAKERAAMKRRAPHVLVTTPESLFVLLASRGGQAMLRTVRTVIVDEIHALARDKRGSHLALSLERLTELCRAHSGREVQRIGLSATQKPLSEVARLLTGAGRACTVVDAGHLRRLDLGAIVPDTPLAAVCSHEQWRELYVKMADLIRAHRVSLVFVNTRKMAERLTARLSEELGPDAVTCHHGSLSRESRLSAEQRLKAGKLKALVATASLELGIDIGDVDLVMQVGSPRSIATFLQRVGRAGHGVERLPKGRIFPLTLDEAVESVALLAAVRRQLLDATPRAPAALDILAQQIVAACVSADPEQGWREDELFDCLRRAHPYRDVARADFDALLALHARGRLALLHRDAIGRRVMATKRARLPVLTSGGAIPDNADYRVVCEPEGLFIGTLNEDFAIESNVNDIFQLGNSSWRVLKIEPGTVRVADAQGTPPNLPFWLGEAPGRSAELSLEVSRVREECTGAAWIVAESGVAPDVAEQVAEFLAAGRAALGAMPSQRCIVLERFFDESGGMQLVVHAPFGSRVNKALGLALRKRVCRSFGFELQAAADEQAIVLSLGPQHAFELETVFDWLSSRTARDVLIQAVLATPIFTTRWRWNAGRSLLLERARNGKPVPAPLLRMRAEDLLVGAFPDVVACGETLPPGDIEVPLDHPIVRQTIDDCLTEALDAEGMLGVLRALENGEIRKHAVDTPEPSCLAHGILSAQVYSFLDDAPLEERRTQAVKTRRAMDAKTADEIGVLDAEAIERVRQEAWPAPENAEELHEVLLWMGFATDDECAPWRPWIEALARAGRAVALDGSGQKRWYASEAARTGKEVLRGRLEALGPVAADDPLFAEFAGEILELEAEGAVLRARFPASGGAPGYPGWCTRRLLARIHRYTLDRLRSEIQPVSAAEFLRFLAAWQHASEEAKLEGPRGVLAVVRQLAGFQAPADAWERHILPLRVKGYRRQWLDELAFSGEVAWGRTWGSGDCAARSIPLALLPRADLDTWKALCEPGDVASLHSDAAAVLEVLAARGASFPLELASAAALLPARLEDALAVLAGRGLAACDSFAGLRALFARNDPRRRSGRQPPVVSGRWSAFRAPCAPQAVPDRLDDAHVEHVAHTLLARTGVVFKSTLARERIPVPWRDLMRCFRRLEARGEIHGGRFVAGFPGEQYALPEAVRALRAQRHRPAIARVSVVAADPLNFSGVLTPEKRVASNARQRIEVFPAAG
jgi:ATP-dependent Lhr-like helicase